MRLIDEEYTRHPFRGARRMSDWLGDQGEPACRGRCFDNIMIERLWRSVKYEEVYLQDYAGVRECRQALSAYFAFYNHERRHQSLERRTPSL